MAQLIPEKHCFSFRNVCPAAMLQRIEERLQPKFSVTYGTLDRFGLLWFSVHFLHVVRGFLCVLYVFSTCFPRFSVRFLGVFVGFLVGNLGKHVENAQKTCEYTWKISTCFLRFSVRFLRVF